MTMNFAVRVLRVHEIDDRALACWRNLARVSCHRNPFLMPEFVLPAWKHLAPDQEQCLLVVEHPAGQRWLAAGSFCIGLATPDFPLPHAVASTSPYTFRTGMLLDAAYASHALDVIFCRIMQAGWLCQGLEFPGLRLDSTLARELAASARRLGLSWHSSQVRMVPAVFPDIVSDEYLDVRWSKTRRKSLRRCRNKLAQIGPVSLRMARQPDDVSAALETFFKLEAESWKGQEGTACLSKPGDEAFVRDMVAGMSRQGNVILSELRAGDQVAASAINLTAGSALFAFKIGWNQDFASASPGVLHEAELLLASQNELSEFTSFDSCATENSYIAPIWPERIPVGTGMICASQLSQLSRCLLNAGREVKRLAMSWW